MNYSRSALKQEVKALLRTARPDARLVTLACLAASFVLLCVVDMIHGISVPDPEALFARVQELMMLVETRQIGAQRMLEELLALRGQFGALLGRGLLFGLISSAVTWTANYGYDGYCLRLVRRKKTGFVTLLCALPKWGWVLLSGFLIQLFLMLWAILLCLLGAVATVAILLFVPAGTLGTVLIAAAWLLLAAWMISIVLGYAMTNYILLDDRVDALEAISRSKDMMRGRKHYLFVLLLSFAGWLLLPGVTGGLAGLIVSSITGGVSATEGLGGGISVGSVVVWLVTAPFMLWIQPYLKGSLARFYDRMRHTDIAYGEWEGRIAPVKRPRVREETRKETGPEELSGQDAPDVPRYEAPAQSTPEKPNYE